MRTFKTLTAWVAAYLITHALLHGHELPAQKGTDGTHAAALLARALERSALGCTPHTKAFHIGEGGTKTEAPPDKERAEIASLLTLDFLFKPGRFVLSLKKSRDDDGREVFVIHFLPRPDKEQLPVPPGLSNKARAANWGMNQMAGTITLDESGQVVRIKGDVPANTKGRKWAFFSGEIYKLDFRHTQSLTSEMWAPERTETTLHYRVSAFGVSTTPRPQFFETTYDCTVGK